MASAMTILKKMELNTPMKGIGGLVLDTGIGAGVSYGIGRAYSQHGDKFYGKHAARIAAVGGKVGALVATYFSGGHATFIGGGLNAAGQAGVNAIALEAGLRHGRDAGGKKAVLINKNAALPAGASDMSSIGALGAAAPGRGLTWAQIEELAAGR
jgi:hypothetical protein